MKLSGADLVRSILVVLVGLPFIPATPTSAVSPESPARYRKAPNSGSVPMYFEENVGQTDPRVRFIGRGPEYSVLVSDSETTFWTGTAGADSGSTAIRMEWIGSSDRVRAVADTPLAGKSNYLLGSDPSAWKTGIGTFGKVRLEGVSEGVDVELYGNGSRLEYDMVVQPGADPGRVRIRFSGADRVHVDELTGDLVLSVAGGELRHQKAVAFQPTSSGKRSIEARYTLVADDEVSFELGDYDRQQLLVIDPVVTFVAFVGGSMSDDTVVGMRSDSAGNLYLVGTTRSLDFAPLVSPWDGTYNGLTDVFVLKINPVSGAVQYSTYLGSPGTDTASAIDVDASGSAYIVGNTSDPAFPTTDGAYRRTLAGGSDGFIGKLSPDGSTLAYSTYCGGSLNDFAQGVAVDGGGSAFVSGLTSSSNFETLPGAFDRTLDGTSDGYVLRLDASGSSLLQATFLGGTGPDNALAVDLTNSGEPIVVGTTASSDFPISPGAFDTVREGTVDEGFVIRLASNLAASSYSSFFGRAGVDIISAVVVDSAERAIIAGRTASADLPVSASAAQPLFGGGPEFDGFVARVASNASSLEYCTYQGGTDSDTCDAVAVDANGGMYVTGGTTSANLPTTGGAFDRTLSGPSDAFVAKYLDGGSLAYATFVGGDSDETSKGLALTSNGRVAIGGTTASSNYPKTVSLLSRPADGSEGFVTELSADGASIPFSGLFGGVTRLSGSTSENATAVAVASDGSIVLAGDTNSVNFPNSMDGFDPESGLAKNAFMLRIDSTGRNLISSTVFGGSGNDSPLCLALLPGGDVAVAGTTRSANFPTSPGCFDAKLDSVGIGDAFIVRLSGDGTMLRFGTYLGAGATATSIAVDATEAVYVTGSAGSVDFPLTPGAYDSAPGGTEAYVTKFNATGTSLVYSTFLGGSGAEKGYSIAVDAQGRAAVAGQTNSVDFPVTAGAYQPTNAGQNDVFVAKLGPTGSTADFVTYLGTLESEQPGGLVIDGSGNIVIAGATNSADYPTTPGAFDTSFNGGNVDAFITALSPNGNQLVFSTFYGGDSDDVFVSLARDASGQLWACGSSSSLDLTFPVNAYDRTNAGDRDGLVVALDPSAASLRYATYVGGTGFDIFLGIAIGNADEIVVAGETTSIELATQGFGWNDRSSALVVRFVREASTVGLYVPSSGGWLLRFVNAAGSANVAFTFGAGGAGLVPLAGNWDGLAGDSPGVYDPASGAFFLRNAISPGPADVIFTFGAGGTGAVPIVGDWNGDGIDTVGIYAPATGVVFLRQSNSSGPADLVFSFGPGGPQFHPLSGDWNADGIDSIGLYQDTNGVFFLKNSNASGAADLVFSFGPGGAGFVPVTGDWNGDGRDTVGVRAQSTGVFFLRDVNASGPADYTFGYGAGGETPIVGNWAG